MKNSIKTKSTQTTVPCRAAITSKWPLISCMQLTDDIYANFFLFLLKEEEVKKLECKLSCYMWGQFAVDIKPSKDSQLSAVSNGNSKHILNKELKVFRRLSDLLAQIGLITLAHQKQLRY